MNAYELVGVIFGFVAVWLSVVESVWCWPATVVSAGALAVWFLRLGLYANALLQLFFIAVSAVGLWTWLRVGTTDSEPLRPTWLRGDVRWGITVATGVVSIGTGWWLVRLTRDWTGWGDAAVGVMSVVGQLLLVRKKVDNWVWWIVADLISVVILLAKMAWLTAGLYAVLLVVAVHGLWVWKRAATTH